ncbi:MAG: acyl carrier protein [Ekhidna sp.]|nr:acyl carrier protein [Ekhidna sp.]MBC6409857.1 acyl carrier protein [Ekhidna sp.]MBC6425751.1 acyl carrier protein [Ekhidna sp.]
MTITQENVKTDLLEIIRSYLSEEIEASEISGDKHLINDLKINSAHIVDIVLDIEDKFDIMIDDDAIGKMNTVQDSIDMVLKKAA